MEVSSTSKVTSQKPEAVTENKDKEKTEKIKHKEKDKEKGKEKESKRTLEGTALKRNLAPFLLEHFIEMPQLEPFTIFLLKRDDIGLLNKMQLKVDTLFSLQVYPFHHFISIEASQQVRSFRLLVSKSVHFVCLIRSWVLCIRFAIVQFLMYVLVLRCTVLVDLVTTLVVGRW